MVPPSSHGVSRVPRYFGYSSLTFSFAYVTLTLFGTFSHTFQLEIINTKCCPKPHKYCYLWFSLFRFRSPLLTEYPFLQVLRCFTSLRTPRRSLRCRPMTAGGLPHSEILGSKPCWRLPEAYRILKRPSSVLSAKASTMRPCGRHSQRPCHPAAFLIARLPDDKSSHCSNDHKTIDLETKLKKKSLAKSR